MKDWGFFKNLTGNEVKDFIVINVDEYFKSMKEKLYYKLYEEQTIRKVAASFYIFLITPDEVEKYAKMIQSNSSDNCVYRRNIEIWNLFDTELQQ